MPQSGALRPSPVWTTATLVILLLPGSGLAATAGAPVRSAITEGRYRYDPAIREAYLEAQAALPGDRPGQTPAGQQAGTAKSARSSPKNAPAPLPEEKPAALPTASPTRDTFVLPKMTVEGAREKPPKPLPRLHIPTPARGTKGEPLESPSARSARLIQKHFTPFEQLVGRILHQPLAGEAAKREAAEKVARQLNDIADLLELSALVGLDTPEEQKALRAEFLKAYYGRPR